MTGHGRAMSGISTVHDVPPPELILHLAWEYLSLTSKTTICHAFRIMAAYARLRTYAISRPLTYWDYLHTMGPVSDAPSTLSRRRAIDLSAALLITDFNMGDLIRWLGGDYTHDHIPMDPIERAIAAIRDHPRPLGYPTVDYDRALHVLRHGAPLTAAYACRRDDVIHRNLYDNHTGALKAASAVLKKIVSGCNNHFLLVFPRWIYRFIYGLFLPPSDTSSVRTKGVWSWTLPPIFMMTATPAR